MNQQQNSDIITDALKNLASSAKKPKKKSYKTYATNHKNEIEAALDQGYSWEEIAQEIKRATEAAFPDDPSQVVDIAPATLRKYIYSLRKEDTRQKQSHKPFSANPFNK